MLIKQALRSPVTAISHVDTDSSTILLWGCGGSLHYCDLASENEFSLQLFEVHSIHGIRIRDYSSHILVFGDASVAIVIFNERRLELLCVDQLDDLIIDCLLLTNNTFAVAYGHNMVDIRHFSSSTSLIHRYWHPDITVLFAATFFAPSSLSNKAHPPSSSPLSPSECSEEASYTSFLKSRLIIASGTIFGYLSVWQVPQPPAPSSTDSNDNIVNNCRNVQVCARIKAHEGVIFKCVWNNLGDILATVSDDRTVRLFRVVWDGNNYDDNITTCSLSKVFEGWGHVCRVWDMVFIPSHNGCICTASEDGTLRVWSVGQDVACVSILSGHLGSVWGVTCSAGGFIHSAGNDGCIKTWHLPSQLETSPNPPLSRVQQVAIPPWTFEQQQASQTPNRRQNGVNSVFVSDDGGGVVVVCSDGMTWLVLTHHQQDVQAFTWCPIAHTHRSVVCADAKWKFGVDVEDTILDIVIGHNDGTCTYIHAFNSLSSAVSIEAQVFFTPHSYKCVNTWLIRGHNNALWICTATTQGVCALWAIAADADGQSIRKLLEVTTERQEIAASVLILHIHHDIHLILGDSRGGISIFTLNTPSLDAASWSIARTQFFRRTHAKDPVSVLHAYSGGFVSAGHDGCVCFFAFTGGPTGCFVHINTMSTHPVHTPDMIYIPPLNGNLSLIVGGYHSSHYIVYDVLQNTQHMCIEGGGWKRPHACAISHSSCGVPEVMFVCPVPQGKHQTDLQVFGNLGMHKLTPSNTVVPYALQRNSSFFGKVVYCAITLRRPDGNAEYLAVGGEDCTLKVYAMPELTLVQETTLYKNSSLRALAHAHTQLDSGQGVVLGGGGKLLYYIWMYDSQTEFQGDIQHLPLRKVHMGSVHPQATQDHRINAAQVKHIHAYAPPTHLFVLVLADSRGVVSVLRCAVDYRPGAVAPCTVQAAYTIDISICPLLCCDVHVLPTPERQQVDIDKALISNLLCVAGDTKGDVHMFLLPCKTQANADVTLGFPLHVDSYHAHMMGANAVCLSILSYSQGVRCGGSERCDYYELFLSSGGDDQSLRCRRLVLAIHASSSEALEFAVREIGLVLRPGAAGAAFKGTVHLPNNLAFSNGSVRLMTVAYDQRLSVWSVAWRGSLDITAVFTGLTWRSVASSSDIMHLDWTADTSTSAEASSSASSSDESIELLWLEGAIVNIAEISSLYVHRDLGAWQAIVVGEGLQVLGYV
eukprot:gene24153-29213_t